MPVAGLPPITIPAQECVHGLERDPWSYVAHEVLVFREVRRVLADHGVLFLNLGDSYNSASHFNHGKGGMMEHSGLAPANGWGRQAKHIAELKHKDLVGIPWMVAKALQGDGWWLRSGCPWIKRNVMPETCQDRPASSLEYVFLFAKSKQYYWDGTAVKPVCGRNLRNSDWFFDSWQGLVMDGDGGPLAFIVNPQPSSERHFATFPSKIPEICILAGCPKEVCRICGRPRERIVEKAKREAPYEYIPIGIPGESDGRGRRPDPMKADDAPQSQTVGWTDCGHGDYRPGIVLDPFGGSGTVGAVAAVLKRSYVLIELNPSYVHDIAEVKLQAAETGVSMKESRAGQMALFGHEGECDGRSEIT